MEFFEPTSYQQQQQQHQYQLQLRHPHPQHFPIYSHEQIPHYPDAQHAYATHLSAPMIAIANGAKTNDTKPRLAKDEVDILEREFKKNPKPTTQTKRQFADDMGVDLPRINNWFQNRRAKRKQEKKQESYQAEQAQEARGYSEPSSPDLYNNNGTAFYSDNTPAVPMAPTFSGASGPPPPVAPYNPQYRDPAAASMESLDRTMAAAEAGLEQDEYNLFGTCHDPLAASFGGSIPGLSSSCDRARFPPPDETVDQFNGNQSYSYPSSFSNSVYLNSSPSQSIPEGQPPEEATTNHALTPFINFQDAFPDASMPQMMATFPSQLLTAQGNDGLPRLNDNQFAPGPEPTQESVIGFKYELSESPASSLSPPGPSGLFRSPPAPMDIVSRRKKVQVKPAALVAETLRGRPASGPRTVSHAEGSRGPTESPVPSPMRRIVSAGGKRNVMSGRICKSGVDSSQRSPINLGGCADAGSFLGHNYHSIRNATSFGAGPCRKSSLAPPTPMSPLERDLALAPNDGTRSTASPSEGGVNFVFNADPGSFPSIEGDASLVSPPKTPHAHMVASANEWAATASTADLSDKSWLQYDVPDEPLYTPAQDSFAAEIHMPQPSYLSSMSQPVTPAYAHFNLNSMFGHGSPQFQSQSEASQFALPAQSAADYSVPVSHPPPLGTSHSPTKQQIFQFSHSTAADFSR
ncbi:uncharacterized protein L3040_003103 [Drepanopeziza brunnea f. sp. 'multigermtubi']|uniref:uncharacterized protein n=1 Tax=Drepanopeziza brunnea f. sp. 'multigermtubi' TaxID=698441 RepID=UPI0023A57C0E|nr:hypothetical protein L3040_003103 [Drepanopeziza brunnea f. sp. 'multigermtubi']